MKTDSEFEEAGKAPNHRRRDLNSIRRAQLKLRQ